MNAVDFLPPARHERSDGAPEYVVASGFALLLAIGFVLLASAWFYRERTVGTPSVRDMGLESSFQHGPFARTGIARDWMAQDAIVREHLQSFGWVDRRAEIVRIPIDRAMEIIANESTASSKDLTETTRRAETTPRTGAAQPEKSRR